jgi:flagellar basal-body rod protein FlgB
MNAENLRRKAIANNIANLETPGYRSKGVKFEELLEKVIEGKAQLQQAKPELIQLNDTPLKNNGNDVSLDMEIGKMVENDLRHSTLVQLLKKKYQQVELAAKIQ